MKCFTVFDGYGKRGGGISLGDAAKDGRKGKTKERDKEEKENRKEKKTWHSQGGSNPSSTRTKWHGSKSWIMSKQILAKYVVKDKGDDGVAKADANCKNVQKANPKTSPKSPKFPRSWSKGMSGR